jgi:hypothetical protein
MNVLLTSLVIFFSFLSFGSLFFIGIILDNIQQIEKKIEYIYIIIEALENEKN